MPTVAEDLAWVLNEFRTSRYTSDYKTYREYYEGKQKLAFATEKFRSTFGQQFKEFSENACRTVVDSLADRLKIIGFRTGNAKMEKEPVPVMLPPSPPGAPPTPQLQRQKMVVQDPTAETLNNLWEKNKLDKRATKLHKDSLMLGDGYVIVWPDIKTQEPRIWVQQGNMCLVRYDEETEEEINLAAKRWYDKAAKTWYLNLYYQDVILKYSAGSVDGTFPDTNKWKVYDSVTNTYGRVPMFHFPNAGVCEMGTSELKDIVPLQDGLNKSVLDMMIAMEFASFKQRYVIGLEVEVDEETGKPVDPAAEQYGVSRLLAFADPETKVGEFGTTDLDQFLRVTDKFWTSIAKISGTPLHYFFITTGDFPSGNAMRAAEGKFVNKIADRQGVFGDSWSDVMRFASKITGADLDDVEVAVNWQDAAQPSQAEVADVAVKKQAVGVSRTQILREMGYDEDEIMLMLEESDVEKAQNTVLKQQENPGLNPNKFPVPGPNKRPGKGVQA